MRALRKSVSIALLNGVAVMAFAVLDGAADEGIVVPFAPPEPTPISTPKVKSPLIQKRVKRREQKETEGTEAAERFEADPIIKSPYSVDGRPLEVDPD